VYVCVKRVRLDYLKRKDVRTFFKDACINA
jgi:hypothetical protein